MPKNRSRGKFRKKSKDRKMKNQKAKENLAMVAVNVNQLPNKPNSNNVVVPEENNNNASGNQNVMQLNNTNLNSNQGHNVKRVVSSKMYSSKTKNGKEETMVDILSGVTKNDKSRILRHFRVTKDGKKKSSTVLAKSNGNKIKVLESVEDGDKESVRKYKVKNPEEFKNVLTVQSDEIKGENIIRNMNLEKSKKTKGNLLAKLNKQSLVDHNRVFSKKNPVQFKKIRSALQKSLKSIMKPRPNKPIKKHTAKKHSDKKYVDKKHVDKKHGNNKHGNNKHGDNRNGTKKHGDKKHGNKKRGQKKKRNRYSKKKPKKRS